MSKKLTYRIESLVLPARQAERAAHQACAEARRCVRHIEARLEKLHLSLESHNDSARQAIFQDGGLANAGLYRKCVIDITAAIAEQSGRLAEADKKLRRCRKRLLDAINARKAASGLADRADARRRRRADRAETRENDELHMCSRAAERIADPQGMIRQDQT